MSATFVIAQGGGPTAVINQTLVGAVLEAQKRHPGAKVLGARHGVRGIRDGDYVDLSAVPEAQLRADRRHAERGPRLAPATSRTPPIATSSSKGLKKAGADAFIYIGGNDTAGTQQILTEAAGGSMRLRACAEDHRQRSGRQRPHAGLHLGRASSSPAPSSASISISARCPASMSASSWAGMPAS